MFAKAFIAIYLLVSIAGCCHLKSEGEHNNSKAQNIFSEGSFILLKGHLLGAIAVQIDNEYLSEIDVKLPYFATQLGHSSVNNDGYVLINFTVPNVPDDTKKLVMPVIVSAKDKVDNRFVWVRLLSLSLGLRNNL